MKPVKEDRLKEVLERIRTLLGYKNRYYCLKNTEGSYRFFYSDISYFYSDKRKIILVSKEKEIDFYGKLDALEAELGDSFFPFLGTKNTRTDFKQKNVVIGAKAQESIGMTGIH